MPKPKDPYPVAIREFTDVLSKIDWKDEGFSFEKAYVCSVFSQWAYAEIPEWEMKLARMRRVKLFNASSLFNHLTSPQSQSFNFQQFMQQQEVNVLLRITDNRLMVAIAFMMRGVIFISLRGTLLLEDFFVDAYLIKKYPSRTYPHCGFHRGFYLAVVQSFQTLRKALPHASLIYVTGHSLGGAMAGILYGLWNMGGSEYPEVHSAYSFGMPRYGDSYAMEVLGNYTRNSRPLRYPNHPYHMLHPLDNIPCVPPRFLNYADSDFEWWSTSGKQITSKRERDKRSSLSRMNERFQRWPHHDSEKYIQDIRKLF